MQDLPVVACVVISCGMWDLAPWPGIEPESSALGAGSLSPGGPPGKSLDWILKVIDQEDYMYNIY